jgi:hypothetical protein
MKRQRLRLTRLGVPRIKRPRLPRVDDRRPAAAAAVTLWIAVSPWVWGFAGSRPAVANHVAVLFAFGPLALLIANLRAAAFVTLLGGAWLAVSPWILGYAATHWAWVNELVTGLLLMVVCASAAGFLGRVRRRPGRLPGRRSTDRVLADTAGSHS